MPDWETVEVPRGAYIGWGTKPGQHVTGKVIDYDPTGATDFNGGQCPALEIELTEPAASFNRDGERTTHDSGEIVQLSCGQVSLKRAVRKAELKPGDLVKITLDNLAKTTNGTVKEFGIKIARGAGNGTKPAEDDEPPF